MLGGGTFTSQNKKLPGTYINFVSKAMASSALSDRGILTMPFEFDWAPSGVFKVTPEDIQKNCKAIFGYDYNDAKLWQIREIFASPVRILYAYRLNGEGVKATCTYGTAKYAGIRGNDLKIVIAANADDNTKWDVSAYLGAEKVDEQIKVANAAALVDCAYIDYDKTATLAATAGTALAGGTNSTVTGTNYSAYLAAIEPYSFNIIGVPTTDAATNALVKAFVYRMREQVGVKFQAVLYNYAGDYEGVINVGSRAVHSPAADNADLVYWVSGAEAACAVNASLMNKVYNGELEVDASLTQSQLEAAIDAGKFVFHRMGDEVRTLLDINSLLTDTAEKSQESFRENQAIRVLDQIANDIAVLFNTKYVGAVPNDEAGRVSLWGDIVKHHQELQAIRAIDSFTDEDVKVSKGTARDAVVVEDAISIIGAMAKLYMTITVA